MSLTIKIHIELLVSLVDRDFSANVSKSWWGYNLDLVCITCISDVPCVWCQI